VSNGGLARLTTSAISGDVAKRSTVAGLHQIRTAPALQ